MLIWLKIDQYELDQKNPKWSCYELNNLRDNSFPRILRLKYNLSKICSFLPATIETNIKKYNDKAFHFRIQEEFHAGLLSLIFLYFHGYNVDFYMKTGNELRRFTFAVDRILLNENKNIYLIQNSYFQFWRVESAQK